MAQVLGVVGSPRRNGNTHVLVEAILEGAKERGAGVETLFLDELTIRECDGCHACWKGKPCPKDDDMNAVYPKLIASDAIVFGTPVYWYGPTALMKAFIDRLVYFNCPEHRERIRGKAVAIAVPFEEENPDTGAPLVDFFERCFHYLEMRLVARLLVPGVTRRGEVRSKADRLAEARAIGRRLV